MKIKTFFLLLCVISFISCEEHVCSCKEYKGEKVVNEYEKNLNNALMCEELNTEKYIKGDTILVICGEKNPL